MIEFARKRLNRLPIRLRLTLWYVLLMGLTFALFSGYLLFRIQRSLMNSIDIALQIAVSQTFTAIEDVDEQLAFNDEISPANFNTATHFTLRLLSAQGTVLDTLGTGENVPLWKPKEPGYSTQAAPDGDAQWRIYSQPVMHDDEMVGWIQATQSLETVMNTLQDFRDQLLWGIPLVLSLAGVGGYFLADRALRPIDRITRTAQTIGAGDLSRRIAYQGPTDEVGHLARTFDQMLERLHAAFTRERRFTGDAAHELRTPLTALKGQIEVALSQPREPTEYRNTLRHLASEVDRLIRLSNALLFLSRSDQNQLSRENTTLNLGDLLGVITEQIHPLAQEKGLRLNVEIPASLLVYGDTDHLIRLFLNLLDNAVKYTPVDGQILVQAAPEADRALITVHNSGPGIPAEHLPHVFDRFYRVDTDRSSETGGSGLGLAITREIVRLHGGEISVQSEPDRGTTFIIYLPAASS